MATSVYQNKATVSAPVPSFVTDVLVKPGTRVRAGEVLYRLESKEQHALGTAGKAIEIKAAHAGTVLDAPAQEGCYAPEGSVLCTIAEAGSLAFEINVPYGQKKHAGYGKGCILELPDGTRLNATVKYPLATMDKFTQSEKVIAFASVPFLPEGMNVKAIFLSEDAPGTVMLLPKSAVHSDETLKEYWIMRLSDDSTAVMVPVKTGFSTADSIEILSPALSPQDRIILTGGYGLADGARITVSR